MTFGQNGVAVRFSIRFHRDPDGKENSSPAWPGNISAHGWSSMKVISIKLSEQDDAEREFQREET